MYKEFARDELQKQKKFCDFTKNIKIIILTSMPADAVCSRNQLTGSDSVSSAAAVGGDS